MISFQQQTIELLNPMPQPSVTYLNVTICITHGPDAVSVAVALLLPAVVTPCPRPDPRPGVMILDVNPLPAAAFPVATVFAPKINSFALVVVAEPLFGTHCYRSPRPSSVVTPRYSRIRMSG